MNVDVIWSYLTVELKYWIGLRKVKLIDLGTETDIRLKTLREYFEGGKQIKDFNHFILICQALGKTHSEVLHNVEIRVINGNNDATKIADSSWSGHEGDRK